ncbi:MAG: FAD/NAD(P)-binding oxidoreductase [Nitriliruptor sp.]|nr:MAG: FAD/NAD(P)-binding oxidoreductase [Nitriliruptor sp.]
MGGDQVRDVVIIGGGAVGATLARALSRFHLDVALLEGQAEVAFGVSKANSGIVHSAMHASPDTLKGRLEYPGNLGWRQLHDELGFGLNDVGEVLVALDDEQLVKIEQIRQQGIRKGIPGTQAWTAERTLDAQPNLTREVKGAVWAPTACVFNPYEAVMLVADVARRNGVTIAEEQRVVGIDPPDVEDPDAPLTVRTETDVWRGRFVINAAGLFADDIAEFAGVRDFKILPRKGEEYLLDKRLAGIVTSIIFPCPTPVSKGTLVNPTVDGTIMVGPTAQPVDDKFDTSTTEEGAEQVFTNARKLVPAISERDIIAEFAGLRPVSDTEDFIVGPTERRGFINAAGIQSPGLTGAPALADLLVDILADEGLELEEKDQWDPTAPHPVKFSQLTTEDQQELARRDPRYAHLICRCEIITEAEVRDAMDRGAHTLDGLKFRTRVGMGRCQGGFCTWGCLELLAEHQGITIPEVTKRGTGTWIVCDRDDHPVKTARTGG